jgi:hypothetical protein
MFGFLLPPVHTPVEKNLFVDISKMKKGVGSPPADGVEDEFPTLDFDDTISEELFAIFYGPLDWEAGSDATFNIAYFVDTAPAVAKNVVWSIDYKSIACGDNFDFGGTATVTTISALTTGTPANDTKVHQVQLVIPNVGLIEGGILMVKIYRNPAHGSDDFVGDARLFDVHIKYRADKLGTPV